MCRLATSALSPVPQSASVARRLLATHFTQWSLDDMLPDAQLAVSELVTNAVLHATPPLTLSISCAEGVVEIAVSDGSPKVPEARPHRADLPADLDLLLAAEALSGGVPERDPRLHVGAAGAVIGGRGLLLVAALVAQWGVSPFSTGKAVWVRSPMPDGWPHADGCPCGHAEDASPLASGAFALHRG